MRDVNNIRVFSASVGFFNTRRFEQAFILNNKILFRDAFFLQVYCISIACIRSVYILLQTKILNLL